MTYPLSQTQMGIYVTCMNTQEEGNYNIDILYKLDEDIDILRLAQALDKVIEAHPYVKSRLVTDANGEVVFEDHCADEFHTSVSDIEDIEDVRSHLGEDFDLLHDQLFRLEIYKTKNGNYLYVDFHHIIFDGMSFGVFRADLEKAYAGGEIEVEPMNGFQIAEEEVRMRQSEVYQETKEWYAKEFGAASEVDSMPLADVYDNREEHFVSVWKQLNINKSALSALCIKSGVTKGIVFSAAFGYTLSKFTGDDEALYTTVFHGRTNKAARRTLCMMVRTLPVYHNFTQMPTVVELLQQTNTQTLEVRDRNSYSFGEIHTDLGIQSEICFVYQGNITNCNITLDGKEQVGEDMRKHAAGIKLNIQIITKDGGYYAKLEYPSNKFTPEFIDSFCQTYDNILSEMMVKDTLAEIELCNEEQIAKLDGFNDNSNSNLNSNLNLNDNFNDSDNVLSLFREAAKQYPDNVAVVFKEKQYTYRELDELTDKIAAIIYNNVKDSGKDEPVVSIIIHRNEWMVLASLAALKAGCAYQPLDPSYPQERLNFMVKDADAVLLIADEDLREIVSAYEGKVLLTDELAGDAVTQDSLPFTLHSSVTPHFLFTLLYTSGSTGVPKGVMLEHGNLVAFIKWYRRYYDLKPEHNVAAYASYGFDANMMDMYPALAIGATVHIIAEELRLDIVALNEYYENNHITHSFITTQVGIQFLQNAANHSLKHLSVGGEKLISVDPTANYTLHNAYGPTECTIFTTIYPVLKNEPNIPIGRPTAELECYVMDKNLHRLPVGAAGELVIAGKQVGRGYLNRPDKTAEAFFTYNGKRAYHSGDIVRYREDGNIEFVGRKDGQVKIRGFRIELKEVEAVMRDFQGIRDVTVQAFDDPNGGKFIAAYIVSDNDVDIEALNNFILDQKPPYMVPAVTMQIPAIPLNVNQKVDKKALPKPERKSAINSEQITVAAPLNALETELKAIIASVVNTEEFSITDVLGYVGLTSITSIKLATLIYKRFGIQVNSKTLAKTGSLQSIENEILSKWMKNGNENDNFNDNHNRHSGELSSSSSSAPLTFAQTGVYFDIVRTPGTIAYNMPAIYTFPEGITADVLEKAVVSCLATHKILGTHFEIKGTDVVQVYPQDFVPAVGRTAVDSKEEFDALKAEFVKPFNPATGPLYRVEIVTYDSRVYMLMDTLHLVMDGASVSLFLKQLTDAIDGVAPEQEQYTFFDYAHDEQQLPATPEYAESERYFTETLKTVDGVSNITEDLQPQEGAVPRLAFAETVLDMAKVSDAAKALGVNPSSIFLAAAYYTVSRYTNSQDVCLCTISNGRSNLRISDTIGMFVNTIAIVSHVQDVTVRDFILQTSGDFSAALEHEKYPFAKAAEKFDLSPTLFFQYQVGVLDDMKVKIPGSNAYGDIKQEGIVQGTPKFKFTISIESKHDNGVAVQVQYDDTLYSSHFAQGFADAMAAVIQHFLADVNAPLKHVSMMNSDQAALIATFHETSQADVPVQLYHRLFEQSVEAHADNLALVALNPFTGIYDSFTYAHLNECMNRIAHSLIVHGVKPRDRVAILLPRTSRLIMSQYAILKAGAAYIPCDPKYPTERINLILEDSGSRFIITTKDRLSEFPDRALDVEQLLASFPSAPVPEASASVCPSPSANPSVAVTPDDLAYLIYTSGSTGRPKGVQLMHKGVCNYHHPDNIIQSCLRDECHAALGITTISFDMSVWETGSPLMLGKTLVLAGDDDCNDPNRLAMLIDCYGIDCMTATTSRFMQLLESPAFEEAFRKHIHLAYQGGEGLSMALLRKLQTYPDIRIFNGYGPTETIANSHASELTHADVAHIGKPCVNYTNFIIDNDGNELPVGVVGELVIGGRSVAKGYNNLPEQTASRFVEYHGQRVYKSGDYARWMPDGNVVLLGRKDNQVKLRGLRIELGEVESAIAKVEGVKNVTVIIKKLAGKDHLCAYFTADRTISIDEMKEEISKTLTHYMVPSAYLQMEAFPLTPNGKTDVKHLPEPELARVGGNYVAPVGKAESDFCEIFCKILELDKVSVTDSFFDLGGSSLTATRVVIEATNMGYSISYAQVFEHSAPRSLAALVSGGGNEDDNLDTEITDFDYTKIDALLAQNTLDNFRNGESLELGDVMLTGANGYLGIHILHHLLENHLRQNPQYKVYCLVRHGNNGVTSADRLMNLLFYYFENNYKDMLGKQLIIIDGDVTNPQVLLNSNFNSDFNSNFNSDFNGNENKDGDGRIPLTLINCAAVVKHFSDGTEIEDINIGGLQNCVDFCLKTGARLIQTSTNSTSGQLSQDVMSADTALDEQHSYIGQSLKNKYIRSKFIAERIVFDAIANKGLVAKVMRLGNLSPRTSDGEFQINFRSNSSMGRLHIYQMLGCFGYSLDESKMEFSPIDEVAAAILMLSHTPKECVVLHPVNNHYILLGDVIREMARTLDVSIEEVEDEKFLQILHEAGQDPEKAKVLQSLLAYASSDDNMVYVPANNNYTNSILSRLGFHWNVTSWDYVQRFISAIAALDFFEEER